MRLSLIPPLLPRVGMSLSKCDRIRICTSEVLDIRWFSVPLVHFTEINYTLYSGVCAFSFVKFRTPIAALQGTWDPYPIAMEFKPPCMVLSTIGLEKPGKLNGSDVEACPTHLHQLHVCMPSSKGKTRLLYRMALDFAPYLKHVPFIKYLWQHLANKVCFPIFI